MIARELLAVLIAVYAIVGAATHASAATALAYLESLKDKTTPYLAPSEVDPRFTLALYVNVATSGDNKQRMWVLERDAIGGDWRLAMWDEAYWKKKIAAGAEPPFSWLVSSGRYYRGDRRSGPTPVGVYGIDERKGRYGRGWMQDGMIHVLHIDYHYGDGRMSGVAFHGTTVGRYRRLGTNDSHGCIRMHQTNALRLFDRVTGRDGLLAEDLRWGEVPRFWRNEAGRKRFGYARDGSLLAPLEADASTVVAGAGSPATAVSDAGPDAGNVLTKTGFRALAVIFSD